MRVSLINYTPDAVETLIFTKRTRLKMAPEGLGEIKAWPAEKKAAELEYMKNTIQSQFEFVDYIFCIEGVTRAFTHQLVRHRVGTSFAQQAQRVVNMTDFEFVMTGDVLSEATEHGDGPMAHEYKSAMKEISRRYQSMLKMGVKPQDARGVLPTNIATNIVFKANLRTLSEMAKKRLCVKTQGEFQDVFRAMVEQVMLVHPWAEPFLRVQCASTGTCLFPSLPSEDCHVKPYVYDYHTGKAYGGGEPQPIDTLLAIWRQKRTEIQPIVKED